MGNRNRIVLIGLGLCACFGLVRPAFAEDEAAKSFPADSWVLDFYAAQGFQAPFTNSQTRCDITQYNVGMGWYFVPDISFGFTINGDYTSQPGSHVDSGGANFQFRVHFLDEQKWTIFWDLEMGIIESNMRMPPRGTDMNYAVHTGLGATIRVTDRIDLLGGARYLHFSNADIHGNYRNPSVNGGEGYVGFLFRM